MISVKKLTRRYGETIAIADVSVEIKRGEIVGLLGHNGAGKTTMMKVLTGYLEPSSGVVSVGGHDVVGARQAVQRQIGYLPENAPLYPEMRVQDYLLTMAGLRGLPAAEQPRAVARAVKATHISDRLLQPISTLSKGLRQRVGLAQAILHRPDVLVLDEPTNGLDPTQIESIRGLIRRLGEDATILLSTHILQEIEAVCDRVLVLIGGRLVADAPLAELTRSQRLRLSVSAEDDAVRAGLTSLAGVLSVERVGEDPALPGFTLWGVEAEGGATACPGLARHVTDAGWRLGHVAPEHRSLESVFVALHHEVAQEMGVSS